MLLSCITALKKNVCCGEIIPTNVNFQIYMALVTGQNDRHRPTRSIMRISQGIYYLSDDFIVAPFAVSELPDLLREFSSSPYFLSVVCPSRVPTRNSQ
jgi:hypothetical protein